jgi:hypothetical protein
MSKATNTSLDLANLKLGRKIIITNKNGKTQRTSIKELIEMHDGDTEILINTNKNYYFSFREFLKGESWVKNIVFTDDYDKRLSF